jgi:hypothetical protein
MKNLKRKAKDFAAELISALEDLKLYKKKTKSLKGQ